MNTLYINIGNVCEEMFYMCPKHMKGRIEMALIRISEHSRSQAMNDESKMCAHEEKRNLKVLEDNNIY